MFIKLTRLDNSPIWLNAAFVVTVEPRKGGGAVVVPVGDGLDYDVREAPEAVLSLLGDAPAPAILPVPATDALVPTPADVSPETDRQLVEEARQSPAPRADKAAGDAEASVPAEEKPAEEKPAKKTRKAATVKKPRATRRKKPAMPISDEQVERLKKMMPKSVKKLQNTLVTQFKVADADGAVEALEANGVFTIEETRIVWA